MDGINVSSMKGGKGDEEQRERRQPDPKLYSSEVNGNVKRKTAWWEENEECNDGGGKMKKQRAETAIDDDVDGHLSREDGDDASPTPSEAASGGSEDEEDEDNDGEGGEGDDSEPPSKMKDPIPSKEERLNTLSPEDKARFLAADKRRREDSRIILGAFTRLVSLKAELQKCQQKVDEAQGTYYNIKHVAFQNATNDADDLLLEPSLWNDHYKQLVQFFEREGHSNFKRTITPSDVTGMSVAEAKEMYNLSWWTCRQRKFKRRGELEEFKVLLLNRVKFNWDPHSGPGPERWLRNYGLLKEFKQKHGHVRVPIDADDKLGSWLKTQMTQYRNTQEGKLPALSAERIQLLEDIGVDWGKRRWTTPWDERYLTLLDYKRRFGHANVPWQWKENVALAQWVNSQRKKYKDLTEGRRNNLSEEQISKLNSIGEFLFFSYISVQKLTIDFSLTHIKTCRNHVLLFRLPVEHWRKGPLH